MPRIAGIALSLSLCFLGSKVFAQGALIELYGEGVHRYFAGDLLAADMLFTRVIDNGTEDPRPYYFRGLVRSMQGGDSQSDFETGAQMEAEGRLAVDVGFALSRVQGHIRSEIEKARRDARVAARKKALEMQQARASEAGPATTGQTPAAPAAPPATTDDSVAPADPFSGDEGMRSDVTTVDPVQPTTPEVDSSVNPFGDDPVPATPGAAPAQPPATDPFGSEPAPAAADPFGTEPAPAAADPFGTPPAAGDPFGTSGAAPADDPFAN